MKQAAETTFIPRWEWHDAEARLFHMEEASRNAINGNFAMARIVVPVEEPPAPPILFPARIGSILFGPDGRPMKEI